VSRQALLVQMFIDEGSIEQQNSNEAYRQRSCMFPNVYLAKIFPRTLSHAFTRIVRLSSQSFTSNNAKLPIFLNRQPHNFRSFKSFIDIVILISMRALLTYIVNVAEIIQEFINLRNTRDLPFVADCTDACMCAYTAHKQLF